MNLYEVIYYGTGDPQTSAADIIYLVRAPDFLTAAETASQYAAPNDHEGQNLPVAHVVYEIGKDLAVIPQNQPIVLRGPYHQCADNYCWRRWERKVDKSTGEHSLEWEEKAYGE